MRVGGLVGVLGLFLPFGCESGEEGQSGEDDGDELCGDPSGYDEFRVGLAKDGTDASVSFVDAMPAPPTRGGNTWVLDVVDGAENPLADLQWEVFTWMPDHGHGSPKPTGVFPGEEPGQYVLDPLYFHMAGRWIVTLTLSSSEGEPVDEVEFAFCIP